MPATEIGRPFVVTLGETMALADATAIGSLAYVDRMRLGVGGSESNVAAAIARLGMPAVWIGRVGGDALGERVLREIRGAGVDVRAVVDPEAPTGLMLKEHRTSGSTAVLYYRSGSAGSRLERGDLDEHLIAAAAVLHVTGITPALSDSAAGAVMHAVAIAREHGVAVSFDVNHRSRLWSAERATPVYRAIAAQADILFAGEEEAALLLDEPTRSCDLPRRLSDLGPSEVVVKRGAHGARAVIRSEAYDVAAVPVHVVDTVGAGDAFAAGYLAEWLGGGDPLARLELAVRLGAFACTVPGDWEGAPTRAELELLAPSDPVRR